MIRLRILGIGSALPDRVVTNAELERCTGFPAERIRELFEIDERRWSRGLEQPDPPMGQRCSDLGAAAATAALRDGGLGAADVGALVVVGTTPDSLNPPPDAIVARRLGLHGVPAYSLQAPCTGMFRAVELAAALVPGLDGRAVLVIAADTPSPFFRFGDGVATDQVLNSVLYADGAGALLLGPENLATDRPWVESLEVRTNSSAEAPGITFPAMLSAMPPTPGRYAAADYLGHHDFRRVLRHGSKLAAVAALHLMETLGVAVGDVRYFVTHQATGNIRRIAASYGLPPERIPVNIDRVGNTISASVLILLDEIAKAGTLVRGGIAFCCTPRKAPRGAVPRCPFAGDYAA